MIKHPSVKQEKPPTFQMIIITVWNKDHVLMLAAEIYYLEINPFSFFFFAICNECCAGLCKVSAWLWEILQELAGLVRNWQDWSDILKDWVGLFRNPSGMDRIGQNSLRTEQAWSEIPSRMGWIGQDSFSSRWDLVSIPSGAGGI